MDPAEKSSIGEEKLPPEDATPFVPPLLPPLPKPSRMAMIIFAFKQIMKRCWYGFWLILWRKTLSRWLYIKESRIDSEATTMRFVRSNTSVPVPRVWLNVFWRSRSYIVMSRAPGVELESIWYTSNLETKGRIVDQLADYVKQMRTLKSPYGCTIGSVLGGPVFDCRLYFMGVSGPFPDESRMNKQLRYLKPLEDWPEDIRLAHSMTHEIVFTHGDLVPRNIMVEGSTVTAILDWESAGWFPIHWEYHKARFEATQKRYDLWRPWIPKFIPPFEMESEANMSLVRKSWIPCFKE